MVDAKRVYILPYYQIEHLYVNLVGENAASGRFVHPFEPFFSNGSQPRKRIGERKGSGVANPLFFSCKVVCFTSRVY